MFAFALSFIGKFFDFVILSILKGLQSEWQKVFIITAVIYFVCGFINVILLDADLQPWAKINEDDFKNKSHTNGSAKVGDIHDKKQTNIVKT